MGPNNNPRRKIALEGADTKQLQILYVAGPSWSFLDV